MSLFPSFSFCLLCYIYTNQKTNLTTVTGLRDPHLLSPNFSLPVAQSDWQREWCACFIVIKALQKNKEKWPNTTGQGGQWCLVLSISRLILRRPRLKTCVFDRELIHGLRIWSLIWNSWVEYQQSPRHDSKNDGRFSLMRYRLFHILFIAYPFLSELLNVKRCYRNESCDHRRGMLLVDYELCTNVGYDAYIIQSSQVLIFYYTETINSSSWNFNGRICTSKTELQPA